MTARAAPAHPLAFPPSAQPANDATSGPERLVRLIKAEGADTVLACMVDMQGRLVGKRLTARHVLEDPA
ncbi:MAG TPA: hypothetical protein VGC80_02815, partial [Acetobacteraceae bacterium]